MLQRPTAVSLTVCERVIIEEHTRNMTIVNAFTHLKMKAFPSEPYTFFVLSLLTDGLGNTPFDLAVARLDTMEELFQHSSSYRFNNPLETLRYQLRIRDFSFPEPGRY